MSGETANLLHSMGDVLAYPWLMERSTRPHDLHF